jgi:hypothetical protein
MPKLPTDYSRTVIYIIKCKNNNITEEYIGSTTDFIKRKNCHKSICNNEKSKLYNLKIYNFIRENGGWDNWAMIELEKYPCNDKREAEKREEDIRVERKASLNMVRAFGAETKKEYYKMYYEEHYETNKEQLLERKKEYYETNKEQILERRKEYYEANKEQILKQKKEYRETNKEKAKEYYEANKEKKREYNNKEYICSCGWVGTNNTKYYHLKNIIH